MFLGVFWVCLGIFGYLGIFRGFVGFWRLRVCRAGGLGARWSAFWFDFELGFPGCLGV